MISNMRLFGRRKKLRDLILGLTLPGVLLCGSVFAFSPKNEAPPTALPALGAAQTQSVDANKSSTDERLKDGREQLLALQEQNKIIKDFQDDLLATVYWALGGVFALLLFFAGFSWLTNFKIHESDKAKLLKDVDERINAFEQRIQGHVELLFAESVKDTTSRVDSAVQRAAAELARELELVNQKQELGSANTAKTNERLGVVEEALALQEKRVWRAHVELRRVEEWFWETQDNYHNVLLTQAQELDARLNGGSKAIDGVLIRMKETLDDEIIPRKMKIEASFRKSIERRLSRAEEKEPVLVNDVRLLLTRAEELTPE